MAIRPLTVIAPGDSLLAGRFAPGERFSTWRIHGTDDWQLICTRSGRGRFAWRGGETVATAGDVMLLRPGTLHDYGTHPESPSWENLWVHFRAADAWMDLLDWPEVAPGLMHLRLAADQAPAVHAALEEVIASSHATAARHLRFAANALERVLLHCRAALPDDDGPAGDPRLRAALALMDGDLAADLPVARLARAAGLSPSRFAHLFRERLGLPVSRFREEQRLRRACQLLAATDRAIKAIAAEVGYDDQFYFSQRFRRFAGRSPRAWRQQRRAGR
jgi:AraC family transcriptional regulator of arabinose operon